MRFLVHEIFASIQGEGMRTGLPTVFVRLAGCNLECIWCDSAFSRSEVGARTISIEEIAWEIDAFGMDNVCITGGEPFCHEGLPELISMLLEKGLNVDLETNGSFHVGSLLKHCPGVFLSMDVKTPSSGMSDSFDVANLSLLRPSDQLKFIVADTMDMDFFLGFVRRNPIISNIILTPCDNEGGRDLVERIKKEIVLAKEENEKLRSVLARTRMMLQTHKVLWGSIKGV